MNTFKLSEHPHRRYNPLTGEWVLISPHRTKRPWQGQVEKIEEEKRPAKDPNNYLGPCNVRANGQQNPDYKDTYAFDNDFGTILPDTPDGIFEKGGLLKAISEKGISRVICFSPRFDLTLPEMDAEDIVKIVNLWQQEYISLGKLQFINHVQIFENKGAIMGCSNPHPHGQIWAQNTVPSYPAKVGSCLKAYYEKKKTSLLSDYVALEKEENKRILIENKDFICLVPFWAEWPFEAMIISLRHFSDISQMTEPEKTSFARILKKLTTMYDNLFEIAFPYSSGIHQAPTDGEKHPEWHFHMHFFPPLLRSATVKKFMVGYELLCEPQRDFTPELSAKKLLSLSKVHYKAGNGEYF